MFLLGLFAGLAGASIVALVAILSFLWSGKTIAAEQNSGSNIAQVGGTVQQPPVVDTAPPVAAGPVKAVDEKNEAIRGNKSAKVTLIEYSDFECPFCFRHQATLDQILKDYPQDVRLVYRHFPLSFHPQAQKAAEASECAKQQGKFWEMHDEIFKANQGGTMSVQKWKDVARQLKLDAAKFDKCLDSGETAAKVAQDMNEGSVAGVQGTPGTFVNGELVEGAVPYATFKQIIDQKLQS